MLSRMPSVPAIHSGSGVAAGWYHGRPMTEAAPGFLEFLRSMDLRIFQEREVGLDIYLSGVWGILPAALAVASLTVFFLAIFQAIPRRSHSIPLLLVLGVLGGSLGGCGSYLQYRARFRPEETPPRVLVEGRGKPPSARPGGEAALLSLPLLLGGLTLAGDLLGSLFLALFGAADGAGGPPGGGGGRGGGGTGGRPRSRA
jgi:hypothetical protein